MKKAIIGIAWLIVAALGIYWIYDILTRQAESDVFWKEIDKKQAELDARALEIDREYCYNNPNDGSLFWKNSCEKFPDLN